MFVTSFGITKYFSYSSVNDESNTKEWQYYYKKKLYFMKQYHLLLLYSTQKRWNSPSPRLNSRFATLESL